MMVVCSACGKIWGKHSFDSSCRTWAIQVDPASVETSRCGTVIGASAVPDSPRGHALMTIIEAK